MTAKYSIETIEEKIKGLPLIDSAAYSIIAILNDPNSDFEQLVEKLTPDIAARFLNMANTAYYGRQVRSINYAVSLLGFTRMKQILITSFLIDHFTKTLNYKEFNFEKFKAQAHFNATVSRVLGEMLSYPKTEELFTVAMLGNIGKLVIAVYFKEEYDQINTLKKNENRVASAAERQILGVTHAEIGAMVLQQFSIPEDLCDAVRYHDADGRQVPLDSNYRLELIARRAAGIVAGFSLPDENQHRLLIDDLQAVVPAGKQRYQNHTKGLEGPDQVQQAFVAALEDVSALVVETLHQQIEERKCQAIPA